MESESCGMRGKEGGGMNGRRLMPHGNRRRGRYLDDTAPRIFYCSPVSEFQLHMILGTLRTYHTNLNLKWAVKRNTAQKLCYVSDNLRKT